MQKLDIMSLTLPALEDFIRGLGEPKFRGVQVFGWLHEKNVVHFDEMTSLSKRLRGILDEKCYINRVIMKKRLESSIDGTIKYLWGLEDGNHIESVFMSYRHGDSLCVSTQAGCRMGCGFCASTLGGLVRNLAVSEMLGQIYETRRDSGRKVQSVVLMGIGEPLDNLENTLDFLSILSSPARLNMSLRHVSLSTCGLVDKIDILAEKKLPLTLSVSLHAPNDEIRSRLMPVNRKWNIDALLGACRRYFDATGRRISFEYALIDGENDLAAHAAELAARLRGMNCHVNLIPVNAVRERGYKRSKAETVARFQDILQRAGVTATVRRELGGDVNAACGQLRREHADEPPPL